MLFFNGLAGLLWRDAAEQTSRLCNQLLLSINWQAHMSLRQCVRGLAKRNVQLLGGPRQVPFVLTEPCMQAGICVVDQGNPML